MTSGTKPRVILGLMTFGPPESEFYGSRVTSLDSFNEFLDVFQKGGYNKIDTARTYVNGLQESFTRAANWQDRGLRLATKCFPNSPGMHSRTEIRAHLEKSLSELGCDSVDIFYLHAPDRSIPFEETLEACNEMHAEGKFQRLGLSNYAAWEVAEIWNVARERGWILPSIYQAMYNVFTRAIEDELIPCCRKYGIDIVVYNPLAGGILSGKYKSKEVPKEGRFSDINPTIGNRYRERFFRDATFEALRSVEPVVQRHNLTILETAFRWCVHHSKLKVENGNDGIIIGASSVSQLKDNLENLEKGPLPEEVVETLEAAWTNVCKATCPLYWR